MVVAADLQIKFSSDTRAAEAGIDRMGSKVKGLGGVMQTALGTAGGFVLGGAINAMIGGFGNLTRGALDFEAQMANVNSIAQLTDGQIKTLSASVNALATETAQAPQTLAAGLYDIYSSGFQGAEALQILEVAAKGATAGMTDTATSSRALVGVLNSGIDDLSGNALTAESAMDILFKTVDRGVITFPELANNMAQTLAPANALGISLEELGASYALMTKQAIPAAQAETALANLMKVATNPTDELTEAVNAFGYESAYALVRAEGLPGLLDAMAEATGGNAEELRKLIPDAEAFNAALALLGEDGGQAYLDMLGEMEKAGGSTDRALAKQSRSASFAMRQAKVAFQQASTVLIGALSPAIQLVARGMAFLATDVLTPAIELFARIADPIGRFAGLLREVFGAGQGVDDLFNVLFGPGAAFANAPQFIQDAARELLNIADAIGDVVAAFRVGGLEGIGDVIVEEIGNVIDSLGTIAGGVIDVAVSLGQIAWDGAVDAYERIKQWVIGQLGLGGGSADGTNATAGMVGDISIGDVGIAVGNLVVSSIAATANDLAPRIQAWIDGHPADNIIQVVNITELQPTFRSLSRNDYDGAIKRFLQADPIEITPEIKLNIREAVANAISDADTGGGGEPGWDRLVTILQNSYLLANPARVFGEWVADDIVIGIGQALIGAFEGLTQGTESFNLMTGTSVLGDSIAVQIGDMIRDIPGDIAEYVGDLEIDIDAPELPDWIENAALFLWPITSFVSAVNLAADGVRAAFANLRDAFSEGANANQPAFMPFGMGGDAPGMDLGLSGEQFRPDEPIEVPVTLVPHYTWATPGGDAFNPFGMGGDAGFGESLLGTLGGSGKLTPLKAFVDVTLMPGTINTSNVDTAAETALAGTKAAVEQTFNATFTADNSDVAVKYTDAMAWGGIWGGSTFTGIFAADNGAVAVAYTEAFGWGNAWAGQVFTASFSVDTSGITNAVAVARQAAADIAAVMPHSPAREGPLSEPIRFDFIADNLRAAMARMGPTAESGMGAVADRLGRGVGFDFAGRGVYGSDGAGGGGGVTLNVTVNQNAPVYGVDDLENVIVDTYMAKVMPGLTVALGRRNRSLGHQR